MLYKIDTLENTVGELEDQIDILSNNRIIESGSNTSWYWEKYDNGMAKLWYVTPGYTVTGSSTSSLLGGYYTYVNISLPSLFIGAYNILASARLGSGIGWVTGIASSTTAARLHVVGNTNSNSITIQSILCWGRWK